jgi:acyl-CoA dehydrogenase
MDLSLSATEKELAASVRGFVEANVVEAVRKPPADDPGVRPDWQQTMARSGWLGLGIPDALGGTEATSLETAVVFEQFGRGPLPPLPLMQSAAVALLTTLAPEAWRDEVLPGLAGGQLVCVPAGLEQVTASGGAARPDLRLAQADGGWELTGVLPTVLFAGSADELLVLVRGDGATRLARVAKAAPGVSTRLLTGFLAWGYEVTFAGVRLAADSVVDVQDDDVLAALLRPMLYLSAYSVGGCARSLEMSRSYCDERVQFKQPIGRFQRVQDHVIRALNFTDQARWSMYDAAWRLDTGLPAAAAVHLAKAVASEGYWESTNAAHEVHAGIGSDPLFGLAAYTRMSRTLFHTLGAPRWHRRRMIRAVLTEVGAQQGRRAG